MRAGLKRLSGTARRRNSLLPPAHAPAARAMGCRKLSISPVPIRGDPHGIASLTETTVLNWDAILMNWRNRTFVCRNDYLSSLRTRVLDVVLQQNPNPLAMAVRVFRHLSIKDARQVTMSCFAIVPTDAGPSRRRSNMRHRVGLPSAISTLW